MASAGEDQQLRLWDAATGQEQWRINVSGPNEYSIAFAPDGATLAVVAQNSLLLLRTTTGEQLFSVRLEMALQKVAFFPDGRRLVTGGQDQMLRVWDAATGRMLKAVRAHPGSFVFTVVVSPDGQWIASGGNDSVGDRKAARLWNAETLQEHKVLAGHTNAVRGIAFAPDSQTLVTASADQQVKWWDIASGQELKTWRGHTNRIREVAFAPDGKSIASSSDDGTVKVWNVDPTAEPAETLTGHGGEIFPVAISPDGKTAATGSGDTTVKLWDLATGQTLHTLRGHVGRINSIAFAPDGRTLLTGSEDSTFRIWEVASGQPLALYENHHVGGPAIAFLPDG
jgi:WD40 repeat protein